MIDSGTKWIRSKRIVPARCSVFHISILSATATILHNLGAIRKKPV